ncbi:aldo/keto reductase [Streptomyces sp. NRRL B-24484]|uniref:aldo/keto reductase n=1 Tax=Streptomyces sp. NRRL B-24484 TaxID=1463833 RepID=UPI0004C0AAC3|nr:aldo/keto reductase [Streptomyces sp. NRRL B-24484]
MRYRTMGTRRVSALCLGTLPFGTVVDEATAFALLDRFTERGGTFVDTANCYCFWQPGSDGGDSERLLGRWLASRGNRDGVVLASKVGALPGGPGEWPANREGLSRPVVGAAVRRSLERLGTDRLDLLYGHVDDPATPLEETVAAFAEAVADGLAEQIGMSNQRVERFTRSRDLARRAGLPQYAALQQRHSYLTPAPDADFDYQVSLDGPADTAAVGPEVTVLAYGALLNGAYTDPAKPLPAEYDHAGSPRALAELRAVARETGATANQVVYAWMLGGSPAVLPLVGVSRLGQLDEALDAVDLDLTADQLARLDAARTTVAVHP